MFGKGISSSGSLLDAAVKNNIIEKSGSWYSYRTEKIGQGRENAKLFLEKNKDVFKTIEDKVKQLLFLNKGVNSLDKIENNTKNLEQK